MRCPPLALVLLAIVLIALGETSGFVMSQLRAPLQRYARARVAVNPAAHGLAGSAEYDAEVTAGAVFATEAGLSFFHTHAEGLGLIVLFVATVTATALPWRAARGVVHALGPATVSAGSPWRQSPWIVTRPARCSILTSAP